MSTLVTIVICLVWQGAAWAYWGTPAMTDEASSHARMHLEMQSHHHDADGALELDDSVASFFHMMSDSSCSATLLPNLRLQLLRTANAAPASTLDESPRSAFLDHPLRPPRSA